MAPPLPLETRKLIWKVRDDDKRKSYRRIAAAVGCSKTSVHRTLQEPRPQPAMRATMTREQKARLREINDKEELSPRVLLERAMREFKLATTPGLKTIKQHVGEPSQPWQPQVTLPSSPTVSPPLSPSVSPPLSPSVSPPSSPTVSPPMSLVAGLPLISTSSVVPVYPPPSNACFFYLPASMVATKPSPPPTPISAAASLTAAGVLPKIKRALGERHPKEALFVSALLLFYPFLVLDKRVRGGISRFRPDALLYLLLHAVIVEVDEFQHAGYNADDEFKRMMKIFIDLGVPVIFLRFNPDEFTDMNGKQVKSVFKGRCKKTEHENHMRISKRRFESRAKILVQVMENAIEHNPVHDVTVVYMYYSGLPMCHTLCYNLPRGADGKPYLPDDS